MGLTDFTYWSSWLVTHWMSSLITVTSMTLIGIYPFEYTNQWISVLVLQRVGVVEHFVQFHDHHVVRSKLDCDRCVIVHLQLVHSTVHSNTNCPTRGFCRMVVDVFTPSWIFKHVGPRALAVGVN